MRETGEVAWAEIQAAQLAVGEAKAETAAVTDAAAAAKWTHEEQARALISCPAHPP